MDRRIVGILVAGLGLAAAAMAAEPKATPKPAAPVPAKPALPSAASPEARPAAPPARPAAGGEITGWGEPLPADLLVLEDLEGENLAEARKQGAVKIFGARRDLNGDGIPELFFFVDHPMFCWKGEGCSVIVISRRSLTDSWREVGALVAPTPSVIVLTETASEFPALKAVGARTYGWNGSAYEPRSPAPVSAIEAQESE